MPPAFPKIRSPREQEQKRPPAAAAASSGRRLRTPGGSLRKRLARVRLLLCDVDGVLTDGTVTMGGGHEFKSFDIQDGLGLRLLQKQGIRVGWISARPSPVTQQRADDLQIDFLHQDQGSKVIAAENILKQAGLRWEQVCFVGDDVVDLGVLRRAGLAVAVANGIDEARALAHHVTRATGGHGAIREIATLILKAQGKWTPLIKEFSA